MSLFGRINYKIDRLWDNFRVRCQRFKRGWAYGDVWDMDAWFMRTIKPMLIHLKYNGISYPIEFKDRSEWVAVLDEMIDCLDSMDEDYCLKSLGFDDYKRTTRDGWDRICIATMMEGSKNRFFELFSKYFFDLWD